MSEMKPSKWKRRSGRATSLAGLFAVAILTAAAGAWSAQSAAAQAASVFAASHPLVLIALSGLRWDDPQRAPAPHLLAIAQRGSWAPHGMLPVFPAQSAPNLFTIATGLYPGHHGIVAEAFQDPEHHARFLAGDPRTAAESRWYAGTPLWSLAEKQGIRTACIGWTGCSAEIAGARPSYVAHEGRTEAAGALHQALVWLRLPASRRPRLIGVALDEPARTARQFGPDAPQTRAAIRALDAALGRFEKELDAAGEPVDLVVVSDHGFARPDGDWIALSQFAPLQAFETDGLLLYGKNEADRAQVYDRLKRATSEFVAYRLKSFPASLHMNSNPRLGDPVVVATGPYALRAGPAAVKEAAPRAVDGFDPAIVPEMKGIFIAAGPDIVAGRTVEPFEDVNLYPWLAHLLGLKIPKNDGNLNILSGTLRDNGGPEK